MWQKIKNIYHFFHAFSSALFFGFPSKKIIVVGVTGTDGKTTTTSMIYHILTKAGYKSAIVNSLGAKIGNELFKTGYHVTTPNPFQLQKLIKKAKDENVQYFILEATSHGLDQQRLAFIDFKVAAITNVTSDHLDYHKTWGNYLAAKSKLFKNVAFSILNSDDASFKYFKKRASGKILTYSLSKNADFNPQNFPFKLKIFGQYNVQNALASAATATALKINKKTIAKALSTFEGVEGRMQRITSGQKFDVFVDFAHTPNGLSSALKSLKRFAVKKKGKLIIVFGAAGERDKSKRPKMGEIAAKFANFSILTAEDPRSEKVEEICSQIAKGFSKKKDGKSKFKIILDRKEAINFAVQKAQIPDVVALFGKGHEKSMAFASKEYPWNEVEVAKGAILEKIKTK